MTKEPRDPKYNNPLVKFQVVYDKLTNTILDAPNLETAVPAASALAALLSTPLAGKWLDSMAGGGNWKRYVNDLLTHVDGRVGETKPE